MANRAEKPSEAQEDAGRAAKPYRIWSLHCPFNKRGFPVMGSFGTTESGVIVIPFETWNRILEEHPSLKLTQFEVGSYE
jgi:hypothetical protein